MTRQVFPYEHDRRMIDAVLRGGVFDKSDDESALYITAGNLCDGSGSTMLHYDTGGALVATIPLGSMEPMLVRALNYVLERVAGDTGDYERITRGTDELNPEDPNIEMVARYLYAGSYVNAGTPFVLVGAMGIQAYRASLKSSAE